MDAVQGFAAARPLPIPRFDANRASLSYVGGTRSIGRQRARVQQDLARKKIIHPLDLVDYYRGLAREYGVTVHEASIIIETRP